MNKHFQQRTQVLLLIVFAHLRRWTGRFPPIGKAKLLTALQTERALLESLISDLGEDQMIRPDVSDGLSIKDMLVHIMVWDKRGTRWIKAAARGRLPIMPAPGYTWLKHDVDALNWQTFLENKDRSLSDVLVNFRDAYNQLLHQIINLSDQQVDNPWVTELITWRYNHYRDHAQDIRQMRMVQDHVT